VLTCRDITKIKENAKLSADNKMLSLMSSAVSHEMITPLKCIISMAQALSKKIPNESLKYDVDLISTTSKMLLNQVKGHLDRNLLDANLFEP
jgi:signal transduction histidine kinase